MTCEKPAFVAASLLAEYSNTHRIFWTSFTFKIQSTKLSANYKNASAQICTGSKTTIESVAITAGCTYFKTLKPNCINLDCLSGSERIYKPSV